MVGPDLKSMSGAQLSLETATSLGLTTAYCGVGSAAAAGSAYLSLYPLGSAATVLGIAAIQYGEATVAGRSFDSRENVTQQTIDTMNERWDSLRASGNRQKLNQTEEMLRVGGFLAGGVFSSVYAIGHYIVTGNDQGTKAILGAVVIPARVYQAFVRHPDSGCRQSFNRLWNAVAEMRSRATPAERIQADALAKQQAEALANDLMTTP
jgi:hypothetical protein